MSSRHLAKFVFALILLSGSTAFGQNMDQLRARTDAGFDAARLAARTSFEALAGYPKDVRDAVLTLSTRPELIVKLSEARSAGASTVDAIATPLGADVLAAARVVTARPDVLQMLVDRLPVVSLMGQCVGDQMPAVRAILDREAETRSTATRGLVDAWKKRATAKPVLVDQLKVASTDFASAQTTLQPISPDTVVLVDHPDSAVMRENRDESLDWASAITQRTVKPLPADPGNSTSGFGYSAGSATPVTALPGHDEVYFTLVHADKYPELAAAVIEQWYYEHNPDNFRVAVDAWYTAYQETLPQSLGGQGDQLPSILKERMTFEKRYLAATRDPAAKRMYRSEFLDANSKDFPALTRVRDGEIVARLNDTPDRVSGGPVSKSTRSGSGSGGGRSSSGQSSSSSASRSNRSSSSRGSGRSTSASDVTGMASSTRGTRGNSRSNSSSNSNSRSSGSGNFGSSNNSGSGFGSSGSGFGSSGSGFGSSGSGFGSSGSGFGSSGSGSGFGSSGSGSSRSSNFNK